MADLSFKSAPVWTGEDTVAFIALEQDTGLGLFHQQIDADDVTRVSDVSRTTLCHNRKNEVSFHAEGPRIFNASTGKLRSAKAQDRQCNTLLFQDRSKNTLHNNTMPNRPVLMIQDGAQSRLMVTDANGTLRDYAIDWQQPNAAPRGLSFYSYDVKFFDLDGQIFLAPGLTQKQRMDVASAGDAAQGYVFAPDGAARQVTLPVAIFAKADRVDFVLTAHGIVAAIGRTGASAGLWLMQDTTWQQIYKGTLDPASAQVDPSGCKVAFYTAPSKRRGPAQLKITNICK